MLSEVKIGAPSVPTNKEFFIQKSQELVLKVTKTALMTLMIHQKASARAFYDGVISPKQFEISGLDDRTSTFFSKMMEPVTNGFAALPGIDAGFEVYKEALGIADIKNQFLQAMALDPIKAMIVELDNKSPTIVDDINNS